MFRPPNLLASLTRRIGAAVLLFLFSAHAGDGLMAVLCPPGMSPHGDSSAGPHMEGERAPAGEGHFGVSSQAVQDPGSSPGIEIPPGPDSGSDPDSDEMPCPFGLASGVVCSGSATVASASALLGHLSPPHLQGVFPDPDDTTATLLSLKLFRPPRA